MDVSAPRPSGDLSPAARPAEQAESPQSTPAYVITLQAENHQLRAEVEQLRAERARLADRQSRMMELLGTNAPENLVHDLRNLLNERQLLRTLADMD